MNASIIIYTHSDYKDAWPLVFGQLDLYFPNTKKIIFTDKKDKDLPTSYTHIFYDDNLSYTKRISSCLRSIEDPLILFQHEDMILFDSPNINKLKEFEDLIMSEKADFIKLIKAGNFSSSELHENLVSSTDHFLFSVQPTLCKKDKLLTLFDSFDASIYEFEIKVSSACISNNYKKCYMASDINENKRGQHHWDSNIFPYIATAIAKGKWNTLEYKNELSVLFKKYNINVFRRTFLG